MLSQYKNEENYSSNRIKEQFKDRKIDDLESERTKIISNEFLNFFDQIARGNRKYINDLYYLIQYRDGFPEKIFLEMEYLPPFIRWIYRKNFMSCEVIEN